MHYERRRFCTTDSSLKSATLTVVQFAREASVPSFSSSSAVLGRRNRADRRKNSTQLQTALHSREGSGAFHGTRRGLCVGAQARPVCRRRRVQAGCAEI